MQDAAQSAKSDPAATEWANRPAWGNLEANLDFIGQTNLLKQPRRILEIGSGKCAMTRCLHDMGHEVVGIDADIAALMKGREENGKLATLAALGERLPFADDTFDVVLSFDLFEHIPDTDAHLAEVRQVLKPNGYYLLQTPNKITNVIFEMIRSSRRSGVMNAFEFLDEHCSLHTYWQMVRKLDKHGFDVKFYRMNVVNDFFRAKIKRFLGVPGLIALKVANPDNLPGPLRTNFFVEARKRPEA